MSNINPSVKPTPEKTSIGNMPASAIRTFVPILVGYVLAYAFRRWGFVLDEDSTQLATATAVAVLTALYWALVRVLETKFPWVGWFLGLATQPKYAPVDAPPKTPAAP